VEAVKQMPIKFFLVGRHFTAILLQPGNNLGQSCNTDGFQKGEPGAGDERGARNFF